MVYTVSQENAPTLKRDSSKYFCQMSSKSIFIIPSYTISKLVHFFLRHSVVWCYDNNIVSQWDDDWMSVFADCSSVAGRRYAQLQKQVEQLQEELYRSETGNLIITGL